MTFSSSTGLMGATAPGQQVTPDNVSELPPGSVVRLRDGSRLIHLHDSLWLWCCDHGWCYDHVERFTFRLKEGATLCHLPAAPPTTWTEKAIAVKEDAARLDWLESLMRPREGYQEIYLAGLRRGDAEATSFQCELQHGSSYSGRDLRQAIDAAFEATQTEGK